MSAPLLMFLSQIKGAGPVLITYQVAITEPDGKVTCAIIFLDPGAACTFITESLDQQLSLPWKNKKIINSLDFLGQWYTHSWHRAFHHWRSWTRAYPGLGQVITCLNSIYRKAQDDVRPKGNKRNSLILYFSNRVIPQIFWPMYEL